MKMLSSYAWRDEEGNVHFSLRAMLREMNCAVTPDNEVLLEQIIRKTVAEEFPYMRVKLSPLEVD